MSASPVLTGRLSLFGLKPRRAILILALTVGLCLAVLLALNAGPTGVPLTDLPGLLRAQWSDDPLSSAQQVEWLVLWDIRLPRAALGLLVGAALGTAGTVMQGLFRNPLADPGLIGVSAGAALATALVIVLGDGPLASFLMPLGRWAQPLAGLTGGFAGAVLLYGLATRHGTTSVAVVLLGGIALSAFASALTGVLIFLANDRQLRDLTFWTLGSLSGASWPVIGVQLPFVLLACACLPMLAPALNALLLGEADAYHMGAHVERTKRLALLSVACLVGATVSMVGIIGFVGVLVPNLLRLLVGPDHRILLPASAALGAILLLASDAAARTIAAPAEMPVGVITALFGAPCFFWLLTRESGRIG